MSALDTIFRADGRVHDFRFDAEVVSVFDDMVERSVPFYVQLQDMFVDLAVAFLPREGGLVCDIGCSTGTTIGHLVAHPACPPETRFIGIDNSPDMLAKAESKLADVIADRRVELIEMDLNAGFELPECTVVLMNWTLQFVRPLYRQSVVQRIHDGLTPGGAFFLTEKVLVTDSRLNRLYIDLYLAYKRRQGYSDGEIQRKREALENVLIPYRIDENVDLLARCGFETIDIYHRWFNFAAFVALKGQPVPGV